MWGKRSAQKIMSVLKNALSRMLSHEELLPVLWFRDAQTYLENDSIENHFFNLLHQ